jgi:hypothetical protein
MRKDSFRKVIEKVLDEEVDTLPFVKKLPPGQKKIVKQNLLEVMIYELARDFFEINDGYLRLQIIRFLADYSGQKPKDIREVQFNPYDGMSEEELEAEEKRLLSVGSDEESDTVREAQAN